MDENDKTMKEVLKQIFGRNNLGKPKMLGIAGSTCTGKTTLANTLHQHLSKCGLKVQLIKQDEFYKPKEEVRTLRSADNPSIIFYDYDQMQSLEETKMLQEIYQGQFMYQNTDVFIIEGNMITDLESLFFKVDYTLFLTIDKDTCRARRVLRVYDPPDEEGYFDQVVWPAYEHTLARAKMISKTNCIAFKESNMAISPSELIIEFQQLICDKLLLTSNVIDSGKAIHWVSSPTCGAISIFIGTTRDFYNGKEVKELEYESYESMAYSELQRLCKCVRKYHPTVLRIYIEHRLGVVPIGESSVIIATSSPQRKAAIEATQWLIDEIKKNVQIWKKEIYTDGSYGWKENNLSRS